MNINIPKPNERYEDLKKEISGFEVVNETNKGHVLMATFDRGMPSAAICIDTNKKIIYIGKSHKSTRDQHSIPDSDYISGIIYFNFYPADFIVDSLQDWRKKVDIYDEDLTRIISDKLKTVFK